MEKRNSRKWIVTAVGAVIVLGLAYAFWPQAVPVDIGEATRSSMIVTVNEEAKTRVHDAYLVSAPIAGRLLRVEVEAGDAVIGGDSVIATLLPAPPDSLDARTREQAEATVASAEAALRLSRSELNAALANQDLAQTQYNRYRELAPLAATQERVDQALRELRAANAEVDAAKSSISMREAELARARAQLISFTEQPPLERFPEGDIEAEYQYAIPLTAPISGQILRVIQESEMTLQAGSPILEIGNIANDLEIVAELLSTDAVKVKPGQRVIIDNWGGEGTLDGVVTRVEPWGFTKYSALGVEEQRVNVIIQFTQPIAERAGLGHGYRVETRIVIWEDDDVLTVPSAALFRSGDEWAVFKLRGGRARLTPVTVSQNNGVSAAIESGLEENDRVVLYPSPAVANNTSVSQRKVER